MLAGVTFRSEPPPKLSFIDENADRELQLALATPKPPPERDRTHPVSTWELNSLTRGEPTGNPADPGAAQEPLRPYQPTAQEKLLLRGNIPFTKGSAELPGVVPLLDQVALHLSEQPKGGTVIIEGHADTEGTDTSDMFMSLRRAQAVRRYLVNQGIPPTQVRIRGFGAEWPVSAKPATEEERQLNRRAEVLVLTEPGAPTTTLSPAP
jgi:outer membrane protein OmpA-like peptidoglycan-associated protein